MDIFLKKIALLVIVIFSISCLAFSSTTRDYSIITSNSKIKEILEYMNDDELNYLKGNNNFMTPSHIEFIDTKTLGSQYEYNIIVPYIKRNGNSSEIIYYINDKYSKSPAIALQIIISSRFCQTDLADSIYEELYIASIEAVKWMIAVKNDYKLQYLDDPLVEYLNNLKNLYIKGDYTSKYLKDFVQNNYIDLDKTSPGFNKEILFPVDESLKQFYKNYNSNLICADKYYIFDSNNLKCNFQSLSKDEYKKLSQKGKRIYNNAKKAENYREKAISLQKQNKNPEQFYLKALKYNDNLNIVYLHLTDYYFSQKNYPLAEKYALISIDKVEKEKLIYPRLLYILSLSIYSQQQWYEPSIDYAKEYLSLDKTKYKIQNNMIYNLSCIIAESSLELYELYNENKYVNEIIKYANIALKSSNVEIKYIAHRIKYHLYIKQNNLKEAKNEANYLLSIKKDYYGYFSLALSLSNRDEKIYNLKKALQMANTKEEVHKCMNYIAILEQNKINDAMKTLSTFVKKPDWFEIASNCNYGSMDYWYKRQNDFFNSTNNCIEKYKGNNLSSCFNQINVEQKELTTKLEESFYKKQQLMYQQELIRQQQISNFYSAQNEYYQYRNYVDNNLFPSTYTITPIGNLLYINKY